MEEAAWSSGGSYARMERRRKWRPALWRGTSGPPVRRDQFRVSVLSEIVDLSRGVFTFLLTVEQLFDSLGAKVLGVAVGAGLMVPTFPLVSNVELVFLDGRWWLCRD